MIQFCLSGSDAEMSQRAEYGWYAVEALTMRLFCYGPESGELAGSWRVAVQVHAVVRWFSVRVGLWHRGWLTPLVVARSWLGACARDEPLDAGG